MAYRDYSQPVFGQWPEQELYDPNYQLDYGQQQQQQQSNPLETFTQYQNLAGGAPEGPGKLTQWLGGLGGPGGPVSGMGATQIPSGMAAASPAAAGVLSSGGGGLASGIGATLIPSGAAAASPAAAGAIGAGAGAGMAGMAAAAIPPVAIALALNEIFDFF